MRVLLIISILAFSALVWASIGTIQHIRHVRRRHRRPPRSKALAKL
jgi:hypothetical protein